MTGLSNWLVNAFNGEWLRTSHALPDHALDKNSRFNFKEKLGEEDIHRNMAEFGDAGGIGRGRYDPTAGDFSSPSS